jgi:DNA-binding NtrC family response regulator
VSPLTNFDNSSFFIKSNGAQQQKTKIENLNSMRYNIAIMGETGAGKKKLKV